MKISSVPHGRFRTVLALLVFATLTVAGCGSDDDEQLPGPKTGTPPLAGPPSGSDGVEYQIRTDVEHQMDLDPSKQDASKSASETAAADPTVPAAEAPAPDHVVPDANPAPTAAVEETATSTDAPSSTGSSKMAPHDPAKGEPLYAKNCASCHGPRGGGDGPVGQALVPKPAKHHDGVYMNSLSNEHIFKVIKEGGPAVGKSPLMAPWGGVLTDDQIWDLVAFVRSLAEPPYTGPKP